MKVREAMTSNTDCVGPNDRVMAAQDLLKKNHVETLPVMDHHVVSGSLGNKDISEATVKMGITPQHLSVREAMKSDPFTVLDSDEVADADRRMDEHKLQSVTVLNCDKSIVGILRRTRT